MESTVVAENNISQQRKSGRAKRAISEEPAAPRLNALQQFVTALMIVGPLVGLIAAIVMLFGHGVTLLDLLLGLVFYAITGHGITAGYHRMVTHRSFQAKRAVKIILAVSGSMAFEGAVATWAAQHRRHHAYTDVPGDPHSPYLNGESFKERIIGGFHAHVGWLFKPQSVDVEKWAPDIAKDKDLMFISKMFPLLTIVSFAAPALLGYLFTFTAAGAIGGFVWGGLVRICLLQHSTFAVNSACHIWGKKPFITREGDEGRNFAPLAIMSMGENWHNWHHSVPRSARHGVKKHQLDSTARLIWILEKLRLVKNVNWPTKEQINARTRINAQLD